MATIFDKCAKYDTAKKLIEQDLFPYFHELQTRQDVEVVMEGKRRIMLGSNNYLGLTTNEEVRAAAAQALEQYGTGCSGSRFLNGTLNLHTKLERTLAEFYGREDAVMFSTGFQSNLGIISAVCGHGDYIISDGENHASIIDGCRLSFAKRYNFKHSDMDDLERILSNLPEESGKLIVTDGVFSMSGDICKLPDIVELKKKYNAAVMVDDAHGLGVLGKGGRGTASHFGLDDEVDLIMGTFSKSLASLGGFLTASELICHFVRCNSRPFMFSASVTPSSCAAAQKSLEVIRDHPEIVDRLAELSMYMKDRLIERNVKIIKSPTPIIPIYTYEPETTLKAAKLMYERGVYVNPVLPPAAPPDGCLLRASLMATHTEALIDEAVDIIDSSLTDLGIKGR
ncbi:MAG: pyridoxal phosphate-dependent aminotransferase family protein [Clostridia bacterium]|nr:pyridoxal phosphate-dependent aminotransferase family protein [Clostridia bacterium]